jgi:hypothetical protein
MSAYDYGKQAQRITELEKELRIRDAELALSGRSYLAMFEEMDELRAENERLKQELKSP